jgi:hypothetical protein
METSKRARRRKSDTAKADLKPALAVSVKNVVHLLLQEHVRQRIQRLMLAAPRAKPIREPEKVLLVNLVEDSDRGLLDDLIFQSRDS